MKYLVKKEVDVRFLDAYVAIRYGDEDMAYDAPFRDGDTWNAIINIERGLVTSWPKGKTLKFEMKVCDEGMYRLLDDNLNIIFEMHDCYVPNNLLPGDYGDCLSLDIDENGKIKNWLTNANLSDFEEEE